MVPYPSAEEAFRLSNTHTPADDFSSLGLSDFFIAHRRVARHHLDHLSLSGNTQELLSRGVQVGLKRREPYDPILEASIGYAGAAAIAVMDEVAFVNERQDERMEGIEEGALSLVPRVASLEEENRQLREVQRACQGHSCPITSTERLYTVQVSTTRRSTKTKDSNNYLDTNV